MLTVHFVVCMYMLVIRFRLVELKVVFTHLSKNFQHRAETVNEYRKIGNITVTQHQLKFMHLADRRNN